eukprot:jgi/Botrbrau1/13196/Bobra.0351s0009.1
MAAQTLNVSVSLSAARSSKPAPARVAAKPARLIGYTGLSKHSLGAAPAASFGAAVAARIAAPVTRGQRIVATMAKKSVGDLTKADLEGKRVLVRADLNVPLKDGKITDDTRIRAAIPTLKYLLDNGARVLLTSHLGRPKGPEDKSRLTPVVPRLKELLGIDVKKADDCIGDAVKKAVDALKNGELIVLENVRFYPEEEKNVEDFAKKLAANADLTSTTPLVPPTARTRPPRASPSS